MFRRRSFFQGRPIRGGVSDIAWFAPAGHEMTDEQWDEANTWNLAVFVNGDAVERGLRGEIQSDDSFLLCFNAHHEPLRFTLPEARWGPSWQVVMDTAAGGFLDEGAVLKTGEDLEVQDRSIVVLRRTDPDDQA